MALALRTPKMDISTSRFGVTSIARPGTGSGGGNGNRRGNLSARTGLWITGEK
jgi:hypothetical protein